MIMETLNIKGFIKMALLMVIGNDTNLTQLFLSSNQLTGFIAPEIGNLTNLEELWLNENQLTGEIPNSICELTDIGDFQHHSGFFDNQLCPPYPFCLENYVGEQDTTNCD